MGIKTPNHFLIGCPLASEKPPHHMGIKTLKLEALVSTTISSEKPPHHMGIKTKAAAAFAVAPIALKNLPTTWGLRLISGMGELHLEIL